MTENFVSREILQQNRILTSIKSSSVKKLLGEFKKLSENAEQILKSQKDAAGADGKPVELSEENKKTVDKWIRFISQYFLTKKKTNICYYICRNI